MQGLRNMDHTAHELQWLLLQFYRVWRQDGPFESLVPGLTRPPGVAKGHG